MYMMHYIRKGEIDKNQFPVRKLQLIINPRP